MEVLGHFKWIKLHGRTYCEKEGIDFHNLPKGSEKKIYKEYQNVLAQHELNEALWAMPLDALSILFPCPKETAPDGKRSEEK